MRRRSPVTADPHTPLEGGELVLEDVRRALIDAALEGFRDAAMRGLCCEGAWEAAVSAMRSADLADLLTTVRARSRHKGE